ncbi:MAG: endonuclease Q family protein, partial [Candidatus Cloacimonadota bacterium]|nr:endonuclease Q family protein [Candidatus Cloacimonadota bacterium]
MNLAVDLHSHSGYAGGVGQISLRDVSHIMKKKGIAVFGTGDSIFPERVKELKEQLIADNHGLYHLKNDISKFLLQTEVIISTKLLGFKNRTVAHHIILFPNFEAIEQMQKLMKLWKMKNTIGRPFIVCENQQEVQDRLFQISRIHPLLEIIPAHILTPDGILGSKNNLKSFSQFYGKFTPKIKIIETGLSADPPMLEKIPDLHKLTYISNSDCHSAALNRIGREFTILDVDEISYESIIKSMRENRVVFTAEFNPAEGRYYLTGHRANRHKQDIPVIYDKVAPKDLICEQCNKKMKMGVRDRAIQLSDNSLKPIKREFINLIPLIEVVSYSLGIKNPKSKTVIKEFNKIMNEFSSEIKLWQTDETEIRSLLKGAVKSKVIDNIIFVKKGNFSFNPAGFDGNYG